MEYVYIETYGCSANLNNSEIMAGLLTQSGFKITNNIEIADIILVNSCIVKGKTEQKIKRRIQDISVSFPNKTIVVAGCMPETDLKQIKKLNQKVICLGTHHIRSIVRLISERKDTRDLLRYVSKQDEEKILLPKIPENRLISITQISEGCLGDCSYCKTRLAKGNLFSYPIEKIVKSVGNDLKQGAKEVWITSQDCSAYGIDIKGEPQLHILLKRILGLKHNFRLRIGMMNPNFLHLIKDKMIEVYKDKKMYKFMHVPVQSADDSILKHMKRNYSIRIVKNLVNEFRKVFPEMVFATDIITGYPTETEQAHLKNMDFIKEFNPDVLNLSKFSKHKGTECEKMDELPVKVINKRAKEIMDIHRKTAQENKQRFLNRTLSVFVNKKTKIPEVYESRDENYNIVLIKSRENLLGKTIKVRVTQIGVHHIIGEIDKIILQKN